jgi:hypothetical protein
MCIEVELDDTFCHTIGELSSVIGGLPVMDDGATSDPAHCLCSVDLQATAEKYGLVVSDGGKDWEAHWPILLKHRKISKREMRNTNAR